MIDFTGPQRVLEDSEPPVTGRRARHGGHVDDTPDRPGRGRRAAARHGHEAAADAAEVPKSRRRVGWRKGSDVDEEMWPVEAFGGVSDEQFWDDLAADKPLATTARTAQPDTAAKRRPPGSGPLPDLYPADDRGRADSRRVAADGSGTHPQPRPGPDDRTAIQPAQTGPQPSPTTPIATQPYPTATQPSPVATQPTRVTQPVRAAQPARAAQQPAEPRGRSRAGTSADEDPLTSPAYSLRRKGSVDGGGYQSSRRSAVGQEAQTSGLADTQAARGGYADGVPSYRQFDRPSHSANGVNGTRSRSDAGPPDPLRSDGYRSDPLRPDPLRPDGGYGGTVPNSAYQYPQHAYSEPAQSMSNPPYGERYGYGNPAGQARTGGDPRRTNGGWSPGQDGANGAVDGGWGSRPAYPPVNGYRSPYDP